MTANTRSQHSSRLWLFDILKLVVLAFIKEVSVTRGYTMSRSKPFKPDNKTKQLLAYLIDKHTVATITSLVKLCYLSDLVHFKENKKQISSLNYIRWHYGPYDPLVSEYLLSLVTDGTIESEVAFTNDGNEYYKYLLKDKGYNYSLLEEKEIETINSVLNSLAGYGANALIKVAYGTKPMKALGATINGTEHLGDKLNLSAA